MAAPVRRVGAWVLAAVCLYPAGPGLSAPPATTGFDPDQALAEARQP